MGNVGLETACKVPWRTFVRVRPFHEQSTSPETGVHMTRRRSCHAGESHRLVPPRPTSLQLALILLAAVGCGNEASALDTRISSDGYRENNVARVGTASSSGAYYSQPVWTINDGRRGGPYDASISQYAYWASTTTSTVYNCNYGNWWVRVDFKPYDGTVCPFDPMSGGQECIRTISEIDLFSLQDNYSTGADPTTSTITTNYGNVDFHLQYCPPGRNCYTNGSGWVDPPGGYITANNKARTKVSFAPVQAYAVRAALDCAQSARGYVVELEAWERVKPPACTFATIPQDNVLPYVGDDNSTASIIADSDRFWWRYFGSFGDTNANGVSDDIDGINDWLSHDGANSLWWHYGARAATLVQMYDLLAPVDFPRAMVYLERIRQMSNAFLNNRDDKRTGPFPSVDQSPYPPPPYDTYHGRVMPAWGALYDNQWSTQVDGAALFTYPMAAFARRVAEHPDWFCYDYRQDAIKFTNAVLETYTAFRSDMRVRDGIDWGYYLESDRQSPAPWNVTLSSLRPMVEVASAADSELYRASSYFNPVNFYFATNEAPPFIAKNVKFFVDNKKAGKPSRASGTTWYWWRYRMDGYPTGQYPENLSHGQQTLRSLLLVWENRALIDGLLARNGYSQRVANILTPRFFTGIANTFLHRIWYYDYYPGSLLHDLLTDRIDGPNSGVYSSDAPLPSLSNHCDPNTGECRPRNGNAYCAGFVPLVRFDPWVWVRCRDSTFNEYLEHLSGCVPGGEVPGGGNDCRWPALSADNHAALLRYRAWWSGR